jgi:hypothetical protein
MTDTLCRSGIIELHHAMKLKNISRHDVQQLMGSEATRREAEAMRQIISQYEDKYLDTHDIPDNLWSDMICLAIDHAKSN